jgi:hypothetical protein
MSLKATTLNFLPRIDLNSLTFIFSRKILEIAQAN